jgi:hypothetical protein
LNIWIIISWSDWRYGASYSTRAFVQSYPVFALALAAFLERTFVHRKRILVIGLGLYLIGVNLFQILQYNAGVLHYDHMNARYYAAIYLDANPTPLDYSLLDTDEIIRNESNFAITKKAVVKHSKVNAKIGGEFGLATFPIQQEQWIKVRLTINSDSGRNTGSLTLKCFQNGGVVKEKRFRIGTPLSKDNEVTTYECFLNLPIVKTGAVEYVAVGLDSFDTYEGRNAKLTITGLKKP